MASAARRRAAGATSAAAARVWCRLAALHADDEYMRAAVVARDADYAADAGRLLEEIAPLSPPGWRDAPWALASIAYRVVASRPPHPS